MYLLAQVTSTAPNYWPFAVLLICIALIVFLITVARMHAFLALTLAAIAAGLLSGVGTLPGEPLQGHWV